MSTLFSEAIKFKDGVWYNLEYHQRRINNTLNRFYGTTIDLFTLNEMIPEDKRTGLYKCRLIYGPRVHSVEFISYTFHRITNVRIVEDNDISYTYKYADRGQLNALLEKSGCDDIIIVKRNRITDSFAANLVFRSQTGLFTPENCLLPGVKRQYLLDRRVIRRREIRPKDIAAYDRVYFINALIDLEDEIYADISSLL